MKTPRDRIIEKGLEIVGEEDTPYMTPDSDTEVGYWKGRNEVIADIRSRLPQLADEVLNIVVGEIEKMGMTKATFEDIITSLTQDNDKLR